MRNSMIAAVTAVLWSCLLTASPASWITQDLPPASGLLSGTLAHLPDGRGLHAQNGAFYL